MAFRLEGTSLVCFARPLSLAAPGLRFGVRGRSAGTRDMAFRTSGLADSASVTTETGPMASAGASVSVRRSEVTSACFGQAESVPPEALSRSRLGSGAGRNCSGRSGLIMQATGRLRFQAFRDAASAGEFIIESGSGSASGDAWPIAHRSGARTAEVGVSPGTPPPEGFRRALLTETELSWQQKGPCEGCGAA